MLVIAFYTALAAPLVGLAAMAFFARRHGIRSRALKRSAFVLAASVAIHPLVQPIYLESWDTDANVELGRRFNASNLMGKPSSEVERIFGKPTGVWSETPRLLNGNGEVTWHGEPHTAWEYQPLRFYWLGSTLQVFFKNGVVTGFEANDD